MLCWELRPGSTRTLTCCCRWRLCTPACPVLGEEGYRLNHTWSESCGIPDHHPLLGEPIPSAFVLTHDDGREVDVHVYKTVDDRVVALWDTDRTLLVEDLAADGVIDGVTVRCMTASMQLTCHQGYDLPPAHAADVRLLQQLASQSSE